MQNMESKNQEQVGDFLAEKKTLSLSTLDEAGKPWTSTSPYVVVEDKIYLFIGKIAEHYSNMKRDSRVSLMVVSSVEEAMNPFVLKRATFQSDAREIADIPEDLWTRWKERFQEHLLVQLRSMGFSLFEIPLSQGRFVTGYGKAFDVTWDNGNWQQEAVTMDKK